MTYPPLSHEAARGNKTPNGEPRRFLLEIAASPPTICVPWPYAKDRVGYGRLKWHGKQRPAHRVAWEVYNGCEMDRALDACHEPVICHERSCINPLHIRPGTRSDNMADALLDGTDIRGKRNMNAKLTEQQVLAIFADPRSKAAIARDYGVARKTICSIKSGANWGWLTVGDCIINEIERINALITRI